MYFLAKPNNNNTATEITMNSAIKSPFYQIYKTTIKSMSDSEYNTINKANLSIAK